MHSQNWTLPVVQNLTMFTICALLVVVCLKQGSSFLFAAPIGEVVPSYSQVTEDSNLTLNCTLMSYAVTPLRSSALYFIAVYLNNPQLVDAAFYHILTDKTLQLVIPNVKREDGNTFKCYMNDSDLTNKSDIFIGTATVDIGRPPNPIVNVSVISDNFDNMTVSWCPTVPQEDPVASNLSWVIVNSPYSGNCPVWNKDGFHCTCLFCGTSISLPCDGKNQSFFRYMNYSITITSSNTYGSTTASLWFYTDESIVKPRPVTKLVVTPLSSRSLQASWKYPEAFPQLVLLIYQIDIFSEWGLNSTIDVGTNTSWLLTDLTPSTKYAVAVRCKPAKEGYWSDDSLASAETMEDVPAVAPESPVGFFRSSACSNEDYCPVTIFWKLINASLQNGNILGYRLTVESTLCTNSCQVDVIGGESTSVDISPLADGVSSRVRLVAYTSVGESPPHYIFFPPYFRSLPNVDTRGLYAEYTEDGTGIFFSWIYIDDVDNYTLMYCVGKETDKTHCMSSPVSSTRSRHETNFTLSPINPDHVYALSSNFQNGTSGLTPNWICIYDFSGLPTTPELSIIPVTDTSVKVVWSPLTCSTNNRVRVLNYTLSYINNATLDHANITLPGYVTEYIITDMTPELEYSLTLRGVSRSGPGQAATHSFRTDPAKPVNNVTPVIVAVVVSVVTVIIIAVIVFTSWRSHKWCHNVRITIPEKYESKDTLSETVYTNSNYTALSDGEDNLHTSADISTVTPASVMYESEVPPSQNSHQETTEHLESVDSNSSNKTTSTSCESEESIQTYTAVANPETSSESPSLHSLLIRCSPEDGHLPDQGDIILHLPPSSSSGEEQTQHSSDSYGYSQAHQCNNVDCSVDSCSSCDDYKSGRCKEGGFEEPIGDPVTPQIA